MIKEGESVPSVIVDFTLMLGSNLAKPADLTALNAHLETNAFNASLKTSYRWVGVSPLPTQPVNQESTLTALA